MMREEDDRFLLDDKEKAEAEEDDGTPSPDPRDKRRKIIACVAILLFLSVISLAILAALH